MLIFYFEKGDKKYLLCRYIKVYEIIIEKENRIWYSIVLEGEVMDDIYRILLFK